jgi:acetyl/propionyl-CoA carboxylase alpha subunit
MVTSVDIVKEQIFIAAGKPLELKQSDLSQKGHAIECRIYAENPLDNFMPSPGTMTFYKEPRGENIRVDAGVEKACTIESFYDPMISKLIVWGNDREIAREKMIHALNDYIIQGIHTNITYLKHMLLSEAYIRNHINTKYCDDHAESLNQSITLSKEKIPAYLPVFAGYLYDYNKWKNCQEEVSVWKRISYWREMMGLHCEVDHKPVTFSITFISQKGYTIDFEGDSLTVNVKNIQPHLIELVIDRKNYVTYISENDKGNTYISFDGFIFELKRQDVLLTHDEILGTFDEGGADHGNIVSPMPGKVIKINVKEGDVVKKGTTLLIVEAMKMENHITAPADGMVEKINVNSGDKVDGSMRLIILKTEGNK